jgi:hypothetical protein
VRTYIDVPCHWHTIVFVASMAFPYVDECWLATATIQIVGSCLLYFEHTHRVDVLLYFWIPNSGSARFACRTTTDPDHLEIGPECGHTFEFAAGAGQARLGPLTVIMVSRGDRRLLTVETTFRRTGQPLNAKAPGARFCQR